MAARAVPVTKSLFIFLCFAGMMRQSWSQSVGLPALGTSSQLTSQPLTSSLSGGAKSSTSAVDILTSVKVEELAAMTPQEREHVMKLMEQQHQQQLQALQQLQQQIQPQNVHGSSQVLQMQPQNVPLTQPSSSQSFLSQMRTQDISMQPGSPQVLLSGAMATKEAQLSQDLAYLKAQSPPFSPQGVAADSPVGGSIAGPEMAAGGSLRVPDSGMALPLPSSSSQSQMTSQVSNLTPQQQQQLFQQFSGSHAQTNAPHPLSPAGTQASLSQQHQHHLSRSLPASSGPRNQQELSQMMRQLQSGTPISGLHQTSGSRQGNVRPGQGHLQQGRLLQGRLHRGQSPSRQDLLRQRQLSLRQNVARRGQQLPRQGQSLAALRGLGERGTGTVAGRRRFGATRTPSPSPTNGTRTHAVCPPLEPGTCSGRYYRCQRDSHCATGAKCCPDPCGMICQPATYKEAPITPGSLLVPFCNNPFCAPASSHGYKTYLANQCDAVKACRAGFVCCFDGCYNKCRPDMGGPINKNVMMMMMAAGGS